MSKTGASYRPADSAMKEVLLSKNLACLPNTNLEAPSPRYRFRKQRAAYSRKPGGYTKYQQKMDFIFGRFSMMIFIKYKQCLKDY